MGIALFVIRSRSQVGHVGQSLVFSNVWPFAQAFSIVALPLRGWSSAVTFIVASACDSGYPFGVNRPTGANAPLLGNTEARSDAGCPHRRVSASASTSR